MPDGKWRIMAKSMAITQHLISCLGQYYYFRSGVSTPVFTNGIQKKPSGFIVVLRSGKVITICTRVTLTFGRQCLSTIPLRFAHRSAFSGCVENQKLWSSSGKVHPLVRPFQQRHFEYCRGWRRSACFRKLSHGDENTLVGNESEAKKGEIHSNRFS